MDQNVDPNALPAAPAPAAPAVAPAPSPTPERAIDPAYVAQLEQFARDQQAELNRYAPVKEDLDWMLEDDTRREGVKRYRKALEESSQPVVDPVLQQIYDHVDQAVKPAVAYITRQQEAEQRTIKEQNQKFERDNMQFAARLAGEQKLDQQKMLEVAAYADSMATRLQRNVGIEEAWKSLQSFAGPSRAPEGDAPILRADSGAPGVPGPSVTDSTDWQTDLTGSLTKRFAKARRAS